MIHEEIVTFEVAKLAKEKGFPQDVDRWLGDLHSATSSNYYNHKGELNGDCLEIINCICRKEDVPIELQIIAAPTQSLLQRWMRDNGFGEVEVRHWSETNKYPHHYGWEVKDNLGNLMSYSSKMFDTYELALEDALKYALENLV